MPYNVIMLTCAFMYLFFGCVFNTMFQKMDSLKEGDFVPRTNLERIILFVKKALEKRKKNKEKKAKDTSASKEKSE